MTGIFLRFLIFFGTSFLGISVIIFSFLRKRISKRSRQIRKEVKSRTKNSAQSWFKSGK